MSQLPEPGSKFARYDVLSLLGAGGMGAVFLAVDPSLGRRVALKVMHVLDEEARARFTREARAAAALAHPHVVTIYEVGEHDGQPFLAMEFVEGKSLRAHIGLGDLPLLERVRVMSDIAQALAATHDAGLVHRDVKPENILVTRAHRGKLLDFGIARPSGPVDASAPTEAPSFRTRDGAVVGTPAYMAPEQLLDGVANSLSDQFAWGLTAFEVVSGAHPVPLGPPLNMAAFLLAGRIPLLSSNPDVDPPLAAVVDRALAAAPENRFPSMDAAVAALDTASKTLRMGARIERATEATPSDVVSEKDTSRLGLAAQVATTTIDPPSTTTSGAIAPASARSGTPTRSRRGTWTLAALLVALGASAFTWKLTRTRGPIPVASALSSAVPSASALVLHSDNAEALSAYREGLAAIHAGDWDRAHPAFQRAVNTDPNFGEAYIWLLQTGEHFKTVSDQREDLRQVRRLRDTLSEHDRMIMEAYEPLLGDPPDLNERQKRLEAAAARFPNDASLLERVGSREVDPRSRLDYADKALAADPTLPDAMQLRAHALWALDRQDDAEKQLVECVAHNPESQCQVDLTTAYMGRGACDKMLAQARSYVAGSAGTTGAYDLFAEALAATGAADEAVADAQRRGNVEKGEWRTFVDGDDAVHLAMLRGRFDDAIRTGREVAKIASGAASAEPHNRAMYSLGGSLDEIGQNDEALKLARQHLRVRESWPRGTGGDRGTPLAFAIIDRSGTPPHKTVWTDATAWLSNEETRVRDRSGLWRIADLARDAQEGQVLLDALPMSFDDLATPLREAFVGRVQLLVGTGKGIDRIARAAHSCDVLDDPLLYIRANLWLGDALAQKGDQPGACAAYAVVIAHWGHDARSRTAHAAAEGARALKCSETH